MANLDAAADKAVHDAVDAFMEGRLVPDFSGETVFETKHSRYRLRDGIVYAAPSDGLIGAELVGWLMETPRRSVVESAWQPGSRAVLVDRARGRNIIVTSSTRLLHLEAGSERPPPMEPQGYGYRAPPSGGLPQLPMLPTPLPPPYSAPRGYGNPNVAPQRSPWPVSAPQGPRVIPAATIPASPSAIPAGPGIPVRRSAVHLPPRPIGGQRSGSTPFPTASSPFPGQAGGHPHTPAAPQSFPAARVAPPAREVAAPTPAADVPWELTSSEIELDVDSSDDVAPTALHGVPAAAESGAGAPIPLVKPRV